MSICLYRTLKAEWPLKHEMQNIFHNKLNLTFWKPILFCKINNRGVLIWAVFIGLVNIIFQNALCLQLVCFSPSSLIYKFDMRQRESSLQQRVLLLSFQGTFTNLFFPPSVYLCHCIHSFLASNGCTQKTTDYSYRVSHGVPLAQLLHFTVKVTEAQECEVISIKITQGVCHN